MAKCAAPPVGTRLKVTEMVWRKNRPIHRVHHENYGADAFNASGFGDARFSPINDTAGHVIPTLYGGENYACALMEVPFHDVSYEPGRKTFDKNKLDPLLHSVLTPVADLRMADLTGLPLHALGVTKNALIQSEKDQYPSTRLWAHVIHAQQPRLQGLCWMSRQHDTQRALMLFGDRIDPDMLVSVGDSRSLVVGDAYDELLDVADILDVRIVPGK